MILLVLPLVAVTVQAQVQTGVAPGDEDPLCFTLRVYSTNTRVLMDSWNYQNLLPGRTGAVWQQVDIDTNNPLGITTNWIQQSNRPCQQSVQVCGFTAGMQNNWLITQLINRTVNGVGLPHMTVLIEFEQPGCDISLNCQLAFNIYVYETSSVDNIGARNTTNYRQVQRVSPETSCARVNETIVINFNSNYSSFYFAIQDETSCIIVTRLIAFYHVCANQTVNLTHYPETIAPPITWSPVPVIASCVENSQTENGLAPVLICSPGGTWSVHGTGCQCVPGYVRDNESCTACPAGTYKSPTSDSCSGCPANSFSEMEGQVQCTCTDGYYRSLQGEEDLACELPPSPPRNLRVVTRTEHSATVIWDPPQRPGSRNLTYGLYISTNVVGRNKIRVVVEMAAMISNLIPEQSYTIYVSSENSITDQVPEEQFTSISSSVLVKTACQRDMYFSPGNASCSPCPANTIKVLPRTHCTCVDGYYRALQAEGDLPCELPPSPPRNINLFSTSDLVNVILTWDKPERPGTRNLVYGVYTSVNGGIKQKVDVVNETMVMILDLLPGKSYTIYISSENTITAQVPEDQFIALSTSVIVSTFQIQTFTESLKYSPQLLVAALIPSLLSLVLMIFVTVLLLKVHKLKHKPQSPTNIVCGGQRENYEEIYYYSTVKDAVSCKTTPTPLMEKNVAYQDRPTVLHYQ